MKIILIICTCFLNTCNVFSQQITIKNNTEIEGKRYFITLEKFNNSSEVWAREKLGMSNIGDVKIAKIDNKVMKKEEALNLICRSKDTYSTIKTVSGCASTVGSGVCLFTGGGGGIGVPVCYVTITYSISTGFVDCISGLTSAISKHFGASDFGVVVEQSLGGLSISSLVTTALEEACADWRKK